MKSGYKIDLNSVSVVFRDNKELFKNMNLSIKPGEFLSICGKSGVGKTTLLRVIAGLHEVESGKILIDGSIQKGIPDMLGYVNQDYSTSLLPWFTVEKNVALALKQFNLSKVVQVDRVKRALTSVRLEGDSDKYPWQLSGGMQQRVAIARALVVEPKLLLLDEPFASLDTFVRLELEDLISTIVHERSITAVVVTHDIDEAIYLGDRIITLTGLPVNISYDSQINIAKPRNQLKTRSSHDFLAIREQVFGALESPNMM